MDFQGEFKIVNHNYVIIMFYHSTINVVFDITDVLCYSASKGINFQNNLPKCNQIKINGHLFYKYKTCQQSAIKQRGRVFNCTIVC